MGCLVPRTKRKPGNWPRSSFVGRQRRRSMTRRIGVPRALLYHKYSSLWEAFLSRLGAEVVVSALTNKGILNTGVQAAEAELCLPVRLFHGHAIDLKGKVDAIFVPRVISVE